MLVQVIQPVKLSRKDLDQYLAAGWFRNSTLMHNSRVIALNDSIYDILNIRFALENHKFSKSLRKIHKKVNQQFRVTVGNLNLNAEKEALYQNHLKRFQGFLVESLELYLFAHAKRTTFNSKEVCVYDGNRLIAYSVFDLGNEAAASIVGLFDDDYAKYSLGLFTMIEEINFAKKKNMAFYYPGYVLKNCPDFDYKLRLGTADYLLPNKKWGSLELLMSKKLPGEIIQEKNEHLQQFIDDYNLPVDVLMNPFYSMGYGFFSNQSFCKALKLGIFKLDACIYGLFYNYEEGVYQLLELEEDIQSTLLLDIKSNHVDYNSMDVPYILVHKQELASHAELSGLLPYIQDIIRLHT